MIRHFFFAVLSAVALSSPLAAQSLLLAPHGVILDDRVRGSAVTVINRSPRAVEVELSTQYGYPVSDSLGNSTIYFPSAEESKAAGNDASGWIIFSPRRFVIPAGRAQAVRFLAKPPADLPDGEYWSRVTFTSKNAATAAPVTSPGDTSGIRIGIDLQVRTVIPIFYRKGPQKTDLEVGTPVLSFSNDSVVSLQTPVKRIGPNAWLGRWKLQVLNAEGKEVIGGSAMTAVYNTLSPRIDIPLRDATRPLVQGTYQVVLDFETFRTDLSPRQYINGPSHRRTTQLVVPARK